MSDAGIAEGYFAPAQEILPIADSGAIR